jgi:hypothetical protein
MGMHRQLRGCIASLDSVQSYIIIVTNNKINKHFNNQMPAIDVALATLA